MKPSIGRTQVVRVKTYLSRSNIHGIGVFAAEEIKKGTVTWSYSPRFVAKIGPEEIAKMSEEERERLDSLDYYWVDGQGNYVFSLDHDKFTNHSFDPNIRSVDDFTDIAVRDIAVGEELTIDYRTITPEETWEDYYAKG